MYGLGEGNAMLICKIAGNEQKERKRKEQKIK